jgi:two-component system cell cycle sensor histidine kinase PleC
MNHTLYILVLLGAASLSISLAVYAWRRRFAEGGRELALLMLAITLWSLTAALEAQATSLWLKTSWAVVSYVGSQSTPVLLVLFALRYAGHGKQLTPRGIGFLFMIPLVSVIMAATNNWHRLLWPSVMLVEVDGLVSAVFGHGPWFWVLVAYGYALVAASVLVLSVTVFRFPHLYSLQSRLILAAALTPWLVNALYTFKPTVIAGLDPTPLAFALSGLFLTWAFVRLRLLDVVPLARDRLIEEMEDAVLVLDRQDCVIDINPTGQRLFGKTSSQLIGVPFAGMWAHWASARQPVDQADSKTVGDPPPFTSVAPKGQIEVSIGAGAGQRTYDVRVSPLYERRGNNSYDKPRSNGGTGGGGSPLGRLVMVRDITEHRQAERKLAEYSRRLEALHEVVALVDAALPIEDMLTQLLEHLGRAIDFDSASAQLVSEDEAYVEVVSDWGFSPAQRGLGLRFPLDGLHPNAQVILTQKPLALQNVQQKYPHFFLESAPPVTGEICAWLGAPLSKGGKAIGMLTLDRREPRPFTDEDIQLAVIVANHAAVKIELARLLRQTQGYADHLEQRVAERTSEIESISSLQRAILQHAGIAIFSTDAQGVIRSFNPAAERMLGYQAEEVIGQATPLQFHDPEEVHQRAAKRNGDAALAANSHQPSVHSSLPISPHRDLPGTEEWTYVRKDGSGLPVLLTISALGEANHSASSHVYMAQDISRRKQAEALLRQSEERLRQTNIELSHAVRMKDEFLATMSHELRTPLNAILSIGESLQDGVYGQLGSRQHNPLKDIVDSGQHLLDLINDILDLSKIEAGMLDLQIIPVNIENVCQSSLRLVKQQAQQKRLGITLSLDGTVSEAPADARRLKQILVNLLGNAVKFTAEGGKIGLEVVGDRQQQIVRFSVWDTGIGIPSSHFPQLFRPFVQLDSSLARQYTGTGLGLVLVQRLAALHGGSVSVQSEVGQGSRFTVTLPLSTSCEPLPETTPAQPVHSGVNAHR